MDSFLVFNSSNSACISVQNKFPWTFPYEAENRLVTAVKSAKPSRALCNGTLIQRVNPFAEAVYRGK